MGAGRGLVGLAAWALGASMWVTDLAYTLEAPGVGTRGNSVMCGVVWVCKTHLGGFGKKNMSFRWELEGRFLEMLMYESYC